MCHNQRYQNGAVYTTRRCRRGPIRALVGAIIRVLETRKQERALLQRVVADDTVDKKWLKEQHPSSFIINESSLPQAWPEQACTSIAAPEYPDKKGQKYVDEQQQCYEYQAPPPPYKKA